MRFNSLPEAFGLRGGRIIRMFDESIAEMYSRDLSISIAEHLGIRVDNCLYAATGKFLVM